MVSLLTLVGVSALVVNLVACRGSQLLAWLKGAEQTVVADTSKVVADIKKI
jgi:hypothetical protein